MYSRNQRGQRERHLQIPENYGGSFLFPNTRMPNPPPRQASNDEARVKAPSYRRTKGRDDVGRTETTARSERGERPRRDEAPSELALPRANERPWYDGNVYGLRGESECDECERRDECGECERRDECDGCERRDECDECDKRDRCGECESHGECEGKTRPSFPPILPQNLLPLNLSKHFPFGHGLGFEELLLLGLILVLSRENADEQTMLLLIILLFCG